MNKKHIYLSVTAIVILAGILWYIKGDEWKAARLNKEQAEKIRQVLDKDRAVLLSRKGTENETFAALIRLADRNNPIAKQEALQRSGDKSPIVRKGVAQALGYFFDDKEAENKLGTLLNDVDESVRFAAIKGVSVRPGTERLQFLRKAFGSRKNISILEQANYYVGFLKLTPQNERQKQMEDLKNLYQKTKDEKVHFEILIAILSQMPRHPTSLSLLEDALNSSNPQVVAHAVRHLGAIQNKPIAEKYFPKLVESEQYQTRLAVIQTLSLACPENRYQVAEKALKQEKDTSIRSLIIDQIAELGGEEGKALLARMNAQKIFLDAEQDLSKQAMKTIENNLTKANRCVF